MSEDKQRSVNGSVMSWGKTKRYVDSLLHDIMNRDNAKERSNFQYVSFDWSGLPGWYFWPKGRDGVYALKELENERHDRQNGHNACFALYYYPALHEAAMADYSLFERVVRKSELFDENEIHVSGCSCHHGEEIAAKPTAWGGIHRSKGIPTHYGREVMSPDLFVVASVELEWTKEQLAGCTVRAPERWRTVVGDKLDRNMPCWDLAWSFVEALASDVNRPYTIARETEDIPNEGVVKSATIAFNSSAPEQTCNVTELRA
ncbi:MAG: hypothetical protein JW884_00435 [Deltaproteobacteria bacterium]|nr:hypothetical protein [Deltaproteobacteria bacterium]